MARSGRRVFQLAQQLNQSPERILSAIGLHGGSGKNEKYLLTDNELISVAETFGYLIRSTRPLVLERLKATETPLAIASDEDELEPLPKRKRQYPHDWPITGHILDTIDYLTPQQVRDIHDVLTKDFSKSKDPISPPGIKDDRLLESAVNRVYTSIGALPKYPTVPMAAAAYLHAIVGNHPFHNGNKRTALVSAIAFMDLNGYVLEVDDDPLFDYMVKVAAHKLFLNDEEYSADKEMIEIARWLHRNSRQIQKNEYPIQFRQLRHILTGFGCVMEFARGKGNAINIRRGNLKTQIHYRNEGNDVPKNILKKVRKDLRLRDEDGYDSAIFYQTDDRIPEFIRRYRKTLDRLAKI